MAHRIPIAWLLLIAVAPPVMAQAGPDPVPLSRLFPVGFAEHAGDRFLHVEPDSLRGEPGQADRCSALWAYHAYLYDNYCHVYRHTDELLALLPDTPRVQALYERLLRADTAFRQVMGPALTGTPVADLHLDSAMRTAARFYYVHRTGGAVVTHVCTGINTVKELGTTVADAHHAAFCYMAIHAMDDHFAPFNAVVAPYRKELRRQPSDDRVREVERAVYAGMARSPALRAALIAEYERKQAFLPFRLVR
ncbi:MAG: hypothetical protein RBT71_06555 [Flavobacteriales bacterium]|jgi:hypothetical protein|nr:hypothetical protein [Flavobacteriales bacterium]